MKPANHIYEMTTLCRVAIVNVATGEVRAVYDNFPDTTTHGEEIIGFIKSNPRDWNYRIAACPHLTQAGDKFVGESPPYAGKVEPLVFCGSTLGAITKWKVAGKLIVVVAPLWVDGIGEWKWTTEL